MRSSVSSYNYGEKSDPPQRRKGMGILSHVESLFSDPEGTEGVEGPGRRGSLETLV